jgi:signal transduction histidine kinase
MTMRLHLFGKIFIGFWFATVAVLASWLISSHYFDTNSAHGALDHRPKGPPHRFVLRVIYELQNLEQADIAPLIERMSAEHEVDIFLLDNAGNDLLGRPLSAKVLEVAEEIQGGRRRAFLRNKGEHMLAHEIYRPDMGEMRAVFVFRYSRHQLLSLLGSSVGLRIGLAVLVSGAVCYLLSLLLTRRVKALQVASRHLATGDLDTRLQVRSRGGDETDELARDFNSMAGQLQERMQAQKRLLGDVSHELRSPLARLRIALALAQENPENAPGHLQRIERETERLEELIGQLLDSQAGELEFDTHIDLISLLQQLCSDANFEGAKQGKRCVLTHSIPEAVVASSGDLLRKSFENVLRNALHHTRPDSEVSVNLERGENEFRVRVIDCGSGVPDNELDKIFEAFYRIDTARTRETGGHGLGLSIAHRAIHRHRGSITAENASSGLAVTITLPAPNTPADKGN